MLTSLAVAEQHDGFASVHVVPGGEVAHGGGRNGGHGVDVEVRGRFQSGKLRVVDTPGATSFASQSTGNSLQTLYSGLGSPTPGRRRSDLRLGPRPRPNT